MMKLAVAVGVAVMLGAGVAHAEPGVDDVVCDQLALGVPPGQIANQLHQGDPRYSVTDTTQTVLDASHTC